ncbi:hypothetical protein ABW20_dc0104865 [Dactylellina cionopaga]|nr:hypothetical protein ABW20_dc0104865 [Dactylellina cionopaga]
MDRNINDFFPADSSRGSSSGRGRRGHHTSNTSESNTDNAESFYEGGRGGGAWRGNGRSGDRGGRGGGRGRGRGGRGGYMSPAKAERARLAKETINVTIPHILSHDNRARNGVESARRYLPSAITAPPKTASTYLPKLSVIYSDTFDAAEQLVKKLKTSSRAGVYNNGGLKVAILNMASNTSPGGGVLNGAQAQEETLCRRSTLYPSLLTDHFHPLNAGAVVYTADVLVFMNQSYEMVKESERFYVDVISAAAPKRPELKAGGKEYAEQSDYEALVLTVKNILRVAAMKGVTHLVLGAFGCGAYGNPNKLVAEVFRRAICGRRFGVKEEELKTWGREEREVFGGIEEVVFAIYGGDRGKGNLEAFEETFEEVVAWQMSMEKKDDMDFGEGSSGGAKGGEVEAEKGL